MTSYQSKSLEAQREVRMRQAVYPRAIGKARGPKSQSEANMLIDMMREIAVDEQMLAEIEAACRRLGRVEVFVAADGKLMFRALK
jgi:hypothetical protein